MKITIPDDLHEDWVQFINHLRENLVIKDENATATIKCLSKNDLDEYLSHNLPEEPFHECKDAYMILLTIHPYTNDESSINAYECAKEFFDNAEEEYRWVSFTDPDKEQFTGCFFPNGSNKIEIPVTEA